MPRKQYPKPCICIPRFLPWKLKRFVRIFISHPTAKIKERHRRFPEAGRADPARVCRTHVGRRPSDAAPARTRSPLDRSGHRPGRLGRDRRPPPRLPRGARRRRDHARSSPRGRGRLRGERRRARSRYAPLSAGNPPSCEEHEDFRWRAFRASHRAFGA